jgi:hypothetical protein
MVKKIKRSVRWRYYYNRSMHVSRPALHFDVTLKACDTFFPSIGQRLSLFRHSSKARSCHLVTSPSSNHLRSFITSCGRVTKHGDDCGNLLVNNIYVTSAIQFLNCGNNNPKRDTLHNRLLVVAKTQACLTT